MTGERDKFILEEVQSFHLLARLCMLGDLNRRNEHEIAALRFLLAHDRNEAALPHHFLVIRRNVPVYFWNAHWRAAVYGLLPGCQRLLARRDECQFIP